MMTINAAELMFDLQRLVSRVADTSPLMQAIGDRQQERIENRIMSGKTDPDGEAWSPWRPWRAAEREAKGNAGQGLLWDTGDLLHSMVTNATLHSVAVGTSVAYADELQFGRHDMEPRPFLGWGAADVAEVERLAVTYILTGAVA